MTGRAECWGAVRLVSEMLAQKDVGAAQGILDAANLTCPNGLVLRYGKKDRQRAGVYDERGELYDVPAWVVLDPEDVVEVEEKDGMLDGTVEEGSRGGDAATTEDGTIAREKGKGRLADWGDMMSVRARLSDRATDVPVQVGSKQNVAALVRGIQEKIGAKRVRLMYLGKVLDERRTLLEQGWVQGHVVNALVFEGDEGMLGLGSLESRTRSLQSSR